MNSRGTQAIASVVLLACAYWCYARTVVPWVTPPVSQDRDQVGLGEKYFIPPTERYSELLASHFSEGSWQRGGEARIIKNNELMLVLREVPTSKEGMLHLNECTLVFLAQNSDSRTWKIEAGGGVDLEFDKPFDPRSGRIGTLVGGFLPGNVTITSRIGGSEVVPSSLLTPISTAAPTSSFSRGQELIQIETSGVQLNSQRITAPYDVHFRYGPSFGSGRGLTIDLKSFDTGDDGRQSGRMENIEVRKIELVALEQLLLYPPPSNPSGLSTEPRMPLRVNCSGPVVFDLEAGIAHIEKDVIVKRARHNQSPDRLECNRLTAHLLRVPRTMLSSTGSRGSAGESGTSSLSSAVPDMELERVIAEGLPAVVTSTTGTGTESRWHRFESERLEYTFGMRRRRVEPITLPPGSISRPEPSRADLSAAGFRAGGSGRYLTGVHSKGVTQMELEWRDRMEFDTSTPGNVDVLLVGDTICRLHQFGHVFAQRLRVGLTGAGNAKRDVASELTQFGTATDFRQLRPHKIVAEERVQIHTDRLDAYTNRLDVDFHRQSPLNPPVANASPLALTAPRGPSLSSALGFHAAKSSRSEANPDRGFGAGAIDGYAEVVVPDRKFAVQGDRLQINILEAAGAHELEDLLLEGHVRCVETSSNASDSPVEMTGNHFRLSDFTESSGLAVIKGEPAVVRARQMAVSGNNIHVDRDQNQIWIEGRGAATMPLPTRMAAQFPNRPAVADIRWEGGLRFDGQTIRCHDNVLIQGPAQRIRAKQLLAKLTRPVDLTAAKLAANAVELQSIIADGNVDVENRTMNESGWLSMDRALVQRVELDYQSQSIEGTGPGWIETVRRPEGDGNRHRAARGTRPVRPAAAQLPLMNDGRLMYLRVEFAKGFRGSMARKTLTFQEQIRSVFGPVPTWDSRLDLQAGELQPETARLSCRELSVFQIPGRGDNPFELSAIGNTHIDGKSTTGQIFSAQAQRLSFDPGKDLLMLHGDMRSKAQLSYQGRVGGRRSTLDAGRIEFRPKANSYKLHGVGMLDLNDFGG